MPQWTPSSRELDDLELISIGAVATDAFGDSPLTLTVPDEVAAQGREAGSIELTDPEGLPLARVEVAQTSPAGAGDDRMVAIAGTVTPLAHHEFGAFRRYFKTPGEVRTQFADAEFIVVPVREPLTDTAIEAINLAAREAGKATAVLLVHVGTGSPRGVSAAGLMRATLAAAEQVDRGYVVAVPVAARDDEEADAWLRAHVASCYSPAVHGYVNDGALPEAVAAAVAVDRPPRDRQGVVIFFTGFSGSGKSTLARALHDVLLEDGARTVTSLDGDVVRRHLSAGLGFSREDRETNIRRIGWVAAEISRHGGMAICSPIAPFDSTRQEVRRMVAEAGGGFVLVHVATPIEECERRDRKGLYARARAGEIPDFTGISSPYDVPSDATVRVDTTGRSIADCLQDVLEVLYGEGWLRPSSRTGDHT